MTHTIRLTITAAFVGLFSATGNAQAPELYQFDVAHAELGFRVRLAGFNRVRGTFENYRGDMLVVGDDPLRSALGLSIDVKSVRTGVDERDEHLRSDAFFDAARWPRITFVSKRIERDGAAFAAVGPLTIRDVTREARVPFAVTSPKGVDPFGNSRFSVAGRLTINRRDFGVVGPAFWNRAISDSVEIEFEMPGRRWDYSKLGWPRRTSGGKLLMDAIEKDGSAKATADVWTLFSAHRADTTYNWSAFEFQKAAGRLAQQGKTSAAIAVLEFGLRVTDAMALPQSSAALHADLAELLLRSGDRASAASHATSALSQDPGETAAIMLLQFLSGDASTKVVPPPPRSGFGLAYDTRRSRLVLFGGSDTTFQRMGDTWEWTGGSWTRVEAPGPPARSDFAMTFDARRGRVVVFGGRTPTGLGRDTWEFDGTRWALVDSTGPSARALTNMAYDDARGRVVLFGGSTGSARLNDTWEWDGHAWREVRAKSAPAARASHAMAYDAARHRVVSIGGYDDDALGDSWEWDGKVWTRVSDGPEILHTAAAFDASSNRILMFGGFYKGGRTAQLWTRAESVWTTIASTGPESRAEHRGVNAPGIGFLIFGGISGQGMSVAERGRAKLNDLWAFDGMRWNRLDP